ncbi:hypothetical protein [Pantoea sp. Z09]|uniref:hypothetical protein n=1 Tax=Pantoea sp. Z09 TaxID=2886821 RepID=UPI001EFD18B8|nr:hypothetical protein [Pantoea sp. Z09]
MHLSNVFWQALRGFPSPSQGYFFDLEHKTGLFVLFFGKCYTISEQCFHSGGSKISFTEKIETAFYQAGWQAEKAEKKGGQRLFSHIKKALRCKCITKGFFITVLTIRERVEKAPLLLTLVYSSSSSSSVPSGLALRL